jgi:hypothetical protein
MSSRRFSSRFEFFEDWLDAKTVLTKYLERIVNAIIAHPEFTLNEARGHKPVVLPAEKPALPQVEIARPPEEPPEYSYRYTLGTNISDQKVPLSFTGYFFSDGEFNYSEELRCYRIFADWVKRCIGRRYRDKNYGINDVLGDWGGVLREEHNAVVDPVPHGSATLEFRVKGVLKDSEERAWEY